MARITVHIGQQKTGSTTLQRALGCNRHVLSRHGILYPKAKYDPDQHAVLVGDYLEKPPIAPIQWAGSRSRLAEIAATEWARIASEAGQRDRVLLSSESFFRRAEPSERARLQQRLGSLGEIDAVIAYIRHPVGHFLSSYQEALKRSRCAHPPPLRPILPALELWSEVSRARLVLRPFERSGLTGGDIVSDFAAAADLPGAEMSPVPKEANTSLSAEAMILLNRRGAGTRRIEDPMRAVHDRMVRQLRRIDADVPGFSRPELRDEIARSVLAGATDHRAARDRWGLEIPGVDYDAIGRAAEVDLLAPRAVEEICRYEPERVEAMAAALDRLDRRVARGASRLRTRLRRSDADHARAPG